MRLKYGLISTDSHAQLDKDAFTSRMSKAKFGDKIPQIVETTDASFMMKPQEHPVHRWIINGLPADTRGVSNCPATMGDPHRETQPQRWEEIPLSVHDPLERLKVLDADRVDAEVLFPNPPVQSASFFQSDDEFELACVQAYNDALIEWQRASDRYIALALVPYMSGIKTTVGEVERAAKLGYRGVLMLAEPNVTLNSRGQGIFRTETGKGTVAREIKPFSDPYWDPLWAACQDSGLVINWHASAGIATPEPIWKGYSLGQKISAHAPMGFSGLAQFLPNLIFSGVLDRYPRIQWVCAESGISWINFVMEACDHEWERRHLWTEGVLTRPSELLKKQIYMSVWFETQGIAARHDLGVDKIMWESDFPHNTSTYPNSWKLIDEVMASVPQGERKAMLWENAARLYGLEVTE
jgi:uncharacterized protein